MGSPAANSGLPRFENAEFAAAYPLGQVSLSDSSLPIGVVLQGFNPFIPADVEASSIPVAAFRFLVTNLSAEPLDISVVAALENFVGSDGTSDETGGNVNEHASSIGLTGVVLRAPDLDPLAEAAGSVALAAMDDGDSASVTVRTGWSDASWGGSLLDFWDDFLDDGRIDERKSVAARPIAGVARSVSVGAGETREVTFLVSWAFPNRHAWLTTEHGFDVGDYTSDIVGNHYTTVRPDPWTTLTELTERLPALETATVAAVTAIVETSAPAAIREAALFNLSTIRSPTVFRAADGRFFAWEGVRDTVGCCFGTCTHVWGYEFATSFLFGEIAWSFRETQYELATDPDGLMSFRVGLPLANARKWPIAAADGQMACLVHLYNDWRLSGDDERLARLWPEARRTLEFAWIPGGWDADRDGVMEGCQHNTMDVEYYGPNPQMGGWYLAALRACEEMATRLGEREFAAECRRLFDGGSRYLDERLFTGEYYRHEIRPPTSTGFIAEGLRHATMGSTDLDDPDLQLGDGVLVDQLVGQYAARIAGLGDILNPAHVNTTLETIFRRNFRTDLRSHFNHMRSYALGDEAGLLMCTYEEGKRPRQPFPYFNEVMTGFEYSAAVGMIQSGRREDALTVIGAIRDRYDGAKRNPFNEAEAGYHYARAMASWSALIAWTGFDYDGREGTMRVDLGESEGSTFWSTGTAWGTWSQRIIGTALAGELRVKGGELALNRIEVGGVVLPLAGGSSSAREGEVFSVQLPLPRLREPRRLG
jgi:uncharacterized protein (DUF608 family)